MLITKDLSGTTAETRARLIPGLLTRSDFVGGGAILKKAGDVQGIAAASIRRMEVDR